MSLTVREEGGFKFVDEGQGDSLLLLHGLFGALSNWEKVTNYFSEKGYRVIIPMLPIYSIPIKEAGLEGLLRFLEEFVEFKELDKFNIIGNSLGGHIGLMYTIKHQQKVATLTLTASSGLFENGMGGSFPKRGNYDFVKQKVEYTFYDPKIASKELVDEVFEVTCDNGKCMRMVVIARSAQRHNMAKQLHEINIPTSLIWGLNDTITPPHVAHEFQRLIPQAELQFIDKCCHAPMMEHPEKFNEILFNFLSKQKINI